LPRLRAKAEEAKIDLSSEQQVIISLLDVGEDDSGEPIEIDVPFTRVQLQALMQPLLEKCYSLAAEALTSARMAGSDLDRILLVGGPTQSPIIRDMLNSRLGASVDFSMDPMTVVAQGAAVYASSLERSKRRLRTGCGDRA
jgi:molecular chaperone DnaK